jgi:hypothetical protein
MSKYYNKKTQKHKSEIIPSEFIKENKSFHELILQLVLAYRLLTLAIPVKASIYPEIIQIFNTYLLQMVSIKLDSHKPALDGKNKIEINKQTRALITRLTENHLSNEVWMAQLLVYLYQNIDTGFLSMIKNYFYHDPYSSLRTACLKIIYQTQQSTISHQPKQDFLNRFLQASTQYHSEFLGNGFLLENIDSKSYQELSSGWKIPPWPLILLLFILIYFFVDADVNHILLFAGLGSALITGFYPHQVNGIFTAFEVQTSLKVRFSYFEWNYLPNLFKENLAEELNKLLIIPEIKSLPIKSSNSLRSAKIAHYQSSRVSGSILAAPALEYKVQPSESNSTTASETKYDPQAELKYSTTIRRKRLGGYIPQLIFGNGIVKEMVTLTLPDTQQTLIYKVGYPHFSLFQLWIAKVNSANPYQKFLVYFASTMFEKVPKEVVDTLRRIASFQHIVRARNQAGFVDIRHSAAQYHFPLRADLSGKLRFAIFKIKTLDSEWRMPVYPHEEKVTSNENREYTFCVTGEPLRIKHNS